MPVPPLAEVTVSTTWFVLGLIALACMAVVLYSALFDRGLR
jgi:hypothetical protein